MSSDAEILKGLGHKVESIEVPRAQPEEQKAQPAPRPQAPKPVDAPPVKKDVSLVLRQLRDTFGIEAIPRADVELNGMTFTLEALTARWVAWADSLVMNTLLDKEARYSPTEYKSRLEVFLAGTCVTAINGESLLEVFGETSWPLAKAKFIDFLMDDSRDGLASEIWEAYEKKIEPQAKVQSVAESNKMNNLQGFKCPVCNDIHVLEKRDNPYFCSNDGAKLEVFETETQLPLS